MQVNCVAPLTLTQTLLSLLKSASTAHSAAPIGIDRAAVVMVSTRMASIADNSGGGYYAYRCSKTALNMATKNLSVAVKDDQILTVVLHPGWVKTDMGGANALIDTDTSVSSIITTLQALGEKDHGTFITWDGKSLPW